MNNITNFILRAKESQREIETRKIKILALQAGNQRLPADTQQSATKSDKKSASTKQKKKDEEKEREKERE